MKRTLLALLIAVPTTGCFGPDVAKAMKALGNDPASVHLRVTSIYGVIEVTRTAPRTNSMPHTMKPDGTISVTSPTLPEVK